jgi:colicin import membrane protein
MTSSLSSPRKKLYSLENLPSDNPNARLTPHSWEAVGRLGLSVEDLMRKPASSFARPGQPSAVAEALAAEWEAKRSTRISQCLQERALVVAERAAKAEAAEKEAQRRARLGGAAIERERKRLTQAQARIEAEVRQQEGYAEERERIRREAQLAQERKDARDREKAAELARQRAEQEAVRRAQALAREEAEAAKVREARERARREAEEVERRNKDVVRIEEARRAERVEKEMRLRTAQQRAREETDRIAAEAAARLSEKREIMEERDRQLREAREERDREFKEKRAARCKATQTRQMANLQEAHRKLSERVRAYNDKQAALAERQAEADREREELEQHRGVSRLLHEQRLREVREADEQRQRERLALAAERDAMMAERQRLQNGVREEEARQKAHVLEVTDLKRQLAYERAQSSYSQKKQAAEERMRAVQERLAQKAKEDAERAHRRAIEAALQDQERREAVERQDKKRAYLAEQTLAKLNEESERVAALKKQREDIVYEIRRLQTLAEMEKERYLDSLAKAALHQSDFKDLKDLKSTSTSSRLGSSGGLLGAGGGGSSPRLSQSSPTPGGSGASPRRPAAPRPTKASRARERLVRPHSDNDPYGDDGERETPLRDKIEKRMGELHDLLAEVERLAFS